MFTSRIFSWPGWAFFVVLVVGLVTAQDSTPAASPPDAAQAASLASPSQRITFDDFVDSSIRQERRLTDFMRSFKPMIETYIQEEGAEFRYQRGIILNGDDYFLSRLDLTGNSPSIVPFADEETWNQGAEKNLVHDPLPFSQVAFAHALFPDLGHFERVGRIWVEDRNYGIVRFRGTFTSRGSAKRAYHFDSWRLNTLGTWWMPAYVYTEEVEPYDPSHKLWFKAQTRVWGYDLRNAEILRRMPNRRPSPNT
jgi:hypothetical protein